MSLSINFAVVSFVDIFRLSSPQGVHDSEPLVVICCGNPIFVCFHDRVVCQIFGGARHVIFVVFFVFFLFLSIFLSINMPECVCRACRIQYDEKALQCLLCLLHINVESLCRSFVTTSELVSL